jgi:tetratricopeptide (TPR) repeat protein
MSKRKQKPGSKSSKKPTAKKVSLPKKQQAPEPALVQPEPPILKSIFWGLFLLFGVLMIPMALNSGINGDDFYQNDYSTKLVDYYSSMGADTAALNIPKGNMHYYGGLFDILTGFTNTALGLDTYDIGYHHVRHIYNVLFGLLAMLFTSLFAKELGGWRAGILTLILLFLSPRFLGHAIMNPKDIPFAAGNIMAVYFMWRWLKNMPTVRWLDLLGLAGGMAIAISTRAGGILLFAYLGLFAGLHFLVKYGWKGLVQNTGTLLKYAGYGIGSMVVAYALAVLFWPFALVDPIQHPFEALSEFSKLGVRIRVLFQGENIMSDATAWSYPLIWIWNTIPLFTIVGVLGSLVLSPRLVKQYSLVPVFMLFFTAFFPLFYVIYRDSLLHDGWRHLTFVYPSMVILASLFWLSLEKLFQKQQVVQYVIYGLLGLMVLEPAVFIVRNISFPYIYFNPLAGGLKNAYGNYETDYWGLSVKQAMQKMEDEGILGPNMEKEIMVASTYSYLTQMYLTRRYAGKVKTSYVRYNQRYSKDWDYGIFPTRYIRGPHLRDGIWPSSKSIFTIDANGIPLTAVYKNSEEKHAFKGEEAIKARDWPTAIQHFKAEVAAYPDNELAWLGLANAYINTQQFGPAQEAANQALKVVPDNLSGLYFLGLAKLNAGDGQGALDAFQRTIQINNEYSIGYYYLAVVQQQMGDLTTAVANAEKSFQVNPRFKAAYDLAAKIHDQLGNTARANQLRQAMQRL